MSILSPTKTSAKVTRVTYTATNLFPATSAADFTVRDTSTHSINIPLARDGVVDMGITITHTLRSGGVDCEMYVGLDLVHNLGSGSLSNAVGAVLFRTVPGETDMPLNGRYTFLPETSPGMSGQLRKAFAVPELRAPLDAIKLGWAARAGTGVPDEGDVVIQVIRRY